MPSYQALVARIQVKKDCMKRCDSISKSRLSKAEKRVKYEVAYTARNKALELINLQVKDNVS